MKVINDYCGETTLVTKIIIDINPSVPRFYAMD